MTNKSRGATSVKAWLDDATNQLKKVGISSARLDAEIILAHMLKKTKTDLHTHPELPLSPIFRTGADELLITRLKRIPIAYLTGEKEFYGRSFKVTENTLIPRPESEDIITLVKQLPPPTTHHLQPTKLLDVGTGSGCLGITLKLEIPELEVLLVDISEEALEVARQNSKQLNAGVSILRSDLLNSYNDIADIVVANLPYVDRAWETSPETRYEPELALFADDNGLSIIYELIDQLDDKLINKGLVALEADPAQHQAIIDYATKKDFSIKSSMGYCLVFIKI